jgi:hypothetical protein
MLRPTASRPVSQDQIFITVRQLQACW